MKTNQARIKKVGNHEVIAESDTQIVFIPIEVFENQPKKYKLIEYYISRDKDGNSCVSWAKCIDKRESNDRRN